MENQTELKWYQKPAGVIILLIFFFPLGLYLMWKNELWTKQTRWIVTAFIAVVIIANAGKNNAGSNSSSSTSSSSSQQEQPKEEESIDGLYSYEDNSAKLTIRISGNSWSGKTIIITGFGSDYDNQNAQYDNGIVKGNDLYESSGMVKVGYVSGHSLTTSIGGQSVTLRK